MVGLIANRKTKNNFVLKDEMRVAPEFCSLLIKFIVLNMELCGAKNY
jgi:hypothetical protein